MPKQPQFTLIRNESPVEQTESFSYLNKIEELESRLAAEAFSRRALETELANVRSALRRADGEIARKDAEIAILKTPLAVPLPTDDISYLPEHFQEIISKAMKSPITVSAFSGDEKTYARYFAHLVRCGWLSKQGMLFSFRKDVPLQPSLNGMEKKIVAILTTHGPQTITELQRLGGRRQDLPVLISHRARVVVKNNEHYQIA